MGRALLPDDQELDVVVVERVRAADGNLLVRGGCDLGRPAAVADALDVPFVDVLTHARVLTADDVEAIRRHAPTPPTLTPEQAADGLGIVDPEPRRVFLATVAVLQQAWGGGPVTSRYAVHAGAGTRVGTGELQHT